jgi:glucokinase
MASNGGLVVGIDLGGTNMQIGVVDQRNRIIGREGKKTRAEEGSKRVIERIAKGVGEACTDAGVPLQRIKAVGIAAAGAIDIAHGIVLDAPNLKWRNLPLRNRLQELLDRPVVVDNDVNGAVWGEYRLGAGQGGGDVVGVWVGTGIGGGLVLNHRLYYGEYFTAGEIGHTVLDPGGKAGRRTLEDLCSRTGMARAIKAGLRRHPRSVIRSLTDGTGQIKGSKQLAAAYHQDDPLTVKVVNEAADHLGIALANLVTTLAVDMVIVGGGVTEALGPSYVRRIRRSFERDVFPARCRQCRIVPTRLADNAGLLGAALLAREHSSAGKAAQPLAIS